MTQGGFDYIASLGIPGGLGEFGNHTFSNGGSASAFSFDVSAFKGLQAKLPNGCYLSAWNQMWPPGCQNNGAALYNACLMLADVPVYS